MGQPRLLFALGLKVRNSSRLWDKEVPWAYGNGHELEMRFFFGTWESWVVGPKICWLPRDYRSSAPDRCNLHLWFICKRGLRILLSELALPTAVPSSCMQLLLLFSLVLVRCCLVLAVAVALFVLKPFIFRTRLGTAHEHPCQAKYTQPVSMVQTDLLLKVLFRNVSLSLQKWRIQTAWFYFISFNSWAKLQKNVTVLSFGRGHIAVPTQSNSKLQPKYSIP